MKQKLSRILRFTALSAFAAWAVWVPFYSLVPIAKAQDMEIPNWTRSAYHITAKGTYSPTLSTSYVNTIRANVSNAGTSWVITVQTREATPKVLWQWHTADAVGNFTILGLSVGITMTSGIDVISSGTTAGVADIEMSYRGVANPSATPFVTPTATATATATYTPTPTP